MGLDLLDLIGVMGALGFFGGSPFVGALAGNGLVYSDLILLELVTLGLMLLWDWRTASGGRMTVGARGEARSMASADLAFSPFWGVRSARTEMIC